MNSTKNFYDKYKKYKKKYSYLKLIQQIGGNQKKHILLDGTSSSGKSTLAKLCIDLGYEYIAVDNYSRKGYLEFMKNIDTSIYHPDDRKAIDSTTRKMMFNEAIKHEFVIFDDNEQEIAELYTKNHLNLYIIIIYASLNKLILNLLSRRTTEPRNRYVFEDYARRYVKTDSESDAIDEINRASFIQNVKENLKYIFKSESDLNEYITNVCSKMDINDDDTHFIKLRKEYRCDLLIKTDGKNIKQIFDELRTKIFN
jgi:dephospho-CoA kinase